MSEQYRVLCSVLATNPKHGVVTLWECLTCSSVVKIMQTHDDWHRQMGAGPSRIGGTLPFQGFIPKEER